MSLKDALNKRNAIGNEQDQERLAEQERDCLPSLNDPIQPYSVSPDQMLKRKPAKAADRIVTIGDSVVLKGDISDCDRVEVSGQFEGTIKAGSIQIFEGGSVKGTLECRDGVMHVIAGALFDHSSALADLRVKSRDFH